MKTKPIASAALKPITVAELKFRKLNLCDFIVLERLGVNIAAFASKAEGDVTIEQALMLAFLASMSEDDAGACYDKSRPAFKAAVMQFAQRIDTNEIGLLMEKLAAAFISAPVVAAHTATANPS